MKNFIKSTFIIFSFLVSISAKAQIAEPAYVPPTCYMDTCAIDGTNGAKEIYRDVALKNGAKISATAPLVIAQRHDNKLQWLKQFLQGQINNLNGVSTTKLNITDTTGNYAKYRSGLLPFSSALMIFETQDKHGFDNDVLQQQINTKLSITDTVGNYQKYYQAPPDLSPYATIASMNTQWLGIGNTATGGNIGVTNTIGFKDGVSTSASTSPYYYSAVNRLKIGINTNTYSGDRSFISFDGDSFSWTGSENNNRSDNAGDKNFSISNGVMSFDYKPTTNVSQFCSTYIGGNFIPGVYGLQVSMPTSSTSPSMYGSTSVSAGFFHADSTNALYQYWTNIKKGTVCTIRSTNKLYVKTSESNSNNHTWEAVAFEKDVVKTSKGTTAQRPNLSSTDAGFIYFNSETLKFQGWTGTAWSDLN